MEGTSLANSARALLQELGERQLRLQLHIDNQAFLLLLQGSTGSWKTQDLCLRANYVREQIQSGDFIVVFVCPLLNQLILLTRGFLPVQLSSSIDPPCAKEGNNQRPSNPNGPRTSVQESHP